MAQPYVGEIRMFAGNFAPAGWLLCEGQLLPISGSGYETLFNLLGTSYGGNGQDTFALPDLRGRLPIHRGNEFSLAQTGGDEEVILTASQTPNHSHALLATTGAAQQGQPDGNVPGRTTESDGYSTSAPTANLTSNSIGPTGGGQPHINLQPYLCVNFIISMYGIFPQQT
jgi:microcystin-dependent protein